MLRLERESEIQGACLCRLGYPGLWRRGKDSNLHCDPWVSFNISVSFSRRATHPSDSADEVTCPAHPPGSPGGRSWGYRNR